MITRNEITALNLSPTKKDFVQIWNELLEVAGKLSERWDPTSTNESDPGIVILKALTGIADKLNYNIDKNTLEAFMPTAAQEDSMRKLCDMLGYNIKYYRSAETTVTIKYHNSDPDADEEKQMSGEISSDGTPGYLTIPKFTVITNGDKDISYFTINETPKRISVKYPTLDLECMEGQIVKCESLSDNNVITVNQVSEQNRFYLPETQIAENGIFIYNIFNNVNNEILGGSGLEDGIPWIRVDNLNTQPRGSRVFKFGFDSYESRPYIEFPEDYSELFNEGIFIYYTRTKGLGGNISPKTLTQLEFPSLAGWDKVSAESFSVENVYSANTGSNIETIGQAYNNYKKTIGTFETLVTCRDYMNKIYTLIDDLGKPYVSNILVTDISNDINRSTIICSCDDAGIFYKETPVISGTKYGELRNSDPVSNTTYSDYAQIGDIVYSDYEKVETVDSDFEQIGETEFSDYRQVGEIAYSDYEQVGDPVFSDYVQVADAEYSDPELLSTEVSEPEQISVDEQETYIASEANKPRISSTVKTSLYYDVDASGYPIMGTRFTCWYLGPEDSANKIYLYADSFGSDWISSEYINPDPVYPDDSGKYFKSAPSIVSYDDNDQPIYEDIDLGTVSEYDSNGNRSDFWIITQGENVFKTSLPINWVKSTNTVIVNQQTKTITNKVTETIEKQRTEKITEQRTATIREQQTATIKLQSTKTIREQRTGTIEKERTKTIENTSVSTQELVHDYAIDRFDLVFYPFKAFSQLNGNIKDIRKPYDASFTYSAANITKIDDELRDSGIKTLAHNIKTPEEGHIISINNYLKLHAIIATNTKITIDECNMLKERIKLALANAFNMRELDFGEEIPFYSIVNVIENADSRIRVASVSEPELYTTFSVLTKNSSGELEPTEYAVASAWLDDETALANPNLKVEKNKDGKYLDSGTFNTDYAKQIYNKLAVRNILAGRVPLFKYNNTFKTNFSEAPYQITTVVNENDPTQKPDSWPSYIKVTEESPYAVWVDNDVIYTGQYVAEQNVADGAVVAGNVYYTKTTTPEEYKDNIIDTNNKGENIINIETDCVLPADQDGTISEVTLKAGEFVRFRAPNFKTVKTYPAYVNYHLDLATEHELDPKPAVATSLFDVLDSDRESWSLENPNVKWQKVLDYFDSIDGGYKKTITLSQKVSAFKKDSSDEISVQLGEVKLSIDVANTPVDTSEYSVETLMALSGCLKLVNEGFKARLEWAPESDESPVGKVPVELTASFTNPFITDTNVIVAIQEAVDDIVNTHREKLPTECAFTISFDFEAVPFEAKSLSKWEEFIRTCAKKDANYTYQVLDFMPVEEYRAIFWRKYDDGYDIGKYITESTEKLLRFNKNYFGLLNSSNYLADIYLVKDLGQDAKPIVIENNEEYALKHGERLFIEYTPSTTTDEGATKELPAVTEILGEGTIIRPIGFETGLMDSVAFAQLGNTPHKTVLFTTSSSTTENISMHSLGANEQIEVRELANVAIDRTFFDTTTDSSVLVYKNFSYAGLEQIQTDKNTNARINDSYTLKDGEYLFYTDKDKSELAFFGSGTEVKVEGNLRLETFEEIDIATIFELGVGAVPWKPLRFTSEDDCLILQEYQYITLGDGDTIKNLRLLETEGTSAALTSDEWKFCLSEPKGPTYTVASAPTTEETLPKINIAGRAGNGWEAQSSLILDVSSNNEQTLRNTNKVKTSLILNNDKENKVDAEPNSTLSFKTNLTCAAVGTSVNIKNEVVNPNKLNGFKLKIFTKSNPMLVHTERGKVFQPVADRVKTNTLTDKAALNDFTVWQGATHLEKDYSDLWQQVDLKEIKPGKDFDAAVKLSPSLLPNTYGIFCIYLKCAEGTTSDTWIEVIPGTKDTDISILNASNNWDYVEFSDVNKDGEVVIRKLPQKLHLNPGINCIRVNKTGTFFIKTSETSSGLLSFDELRLVDYLLEEITTESTAGNTGAQSTSIDTIKTYGLNLDQLGYLKVETVESETYDEAAIKGLVSSAKTNAYESIEDFEQKVRNSISHNYAKLLESKAKVEALSTVLNAEITEVDDISKLSKLDSNYVEDLYKRFSQIKNALARENALLDALKDHEDINKLEQQLVKLLNGFSNIESAQQQLFTELNELVASINIDGVTFSDNVILDDFKDVAVANVDHYSTLVYELKAAAIEKINEQYNEQLAVIAEDLEKINNAEERSRVAGAIENLVTPKQHTNLLAKIQQLIDKINQDQINSYLDTAYTSALQADYVTLATGLRGLREQLQNGSLKTLVAELEKLASENSYAQLADSIDRLQWLLINGEYDALITSNTETFKGIDHVIPLVEAKLTTDTEPMYDSVIVGHVNKIRSEYQTVHSTAIEAALNELIQVLNNINYIPYDDVLETMQTTKNDQALNMLAKIEAITDTRNSDINKVAEFSIDSYEELPFVESVVLSVWPKYMYADLRDGLLGSSVKGTNGLYRNIYTVISANTTSQDEFFAGDVFYIDTTLRKALSEVAKLSTFESLFERAKSLSAQHEQSLANTTLISEISRELLPLSDDIESALTDITNVTGENDRARTAMLCSIIEKLEQLLCTDGTSTDEFNVVKKQQLLETLKRELANVIELDSQLYSIIAELLCPSITLFKSNMPKQDDAFYDIYKAHADFIDEVFDKDVKDDIKTVLETIASCADSDSEWLTDLNNLLSMSNPNSTELVNGLSKLIDGLKSTEESENTETEESENTEWPENESLSPAHLPDNYKSILQDTYSLATTLNNTLGIRDKIEQAKSSGDIDKLINSNLHDDLKNTLNKLFNALKDIESLTTEPQANVTVEDTKKLEKLRKAMSVLSLENQLLAEIRDKDVNKEFYYNVPIEASFAIEFNENDVKNNTLMNPAMFYDVNNVNNSFVISKLDIGYLSNGIDVARSSKFS